MANILVADDDPHIREVVRFALENDNYTVTEAENGNQALQVFEKGSIDLIVLDIIMPEKDGLEVCRTLRATSSVPILFLSSRDEELDRILGLEMGADDYVTKPFSPRELVARVKAMLRRIQAPPPSEGDHSATLHHGKLTLDPMRHQCRWDDQEISLTPTEFLLLESLMTTPEKVYSRGELVDRGYGFGHHITERTVDSHIRRIRKKFDQIGADPIETVYGVGYRLRAQGSQA